MEKILIIDDSPLQTTQLNDILSDEYEITIEQTAEEGFDRARAGNYSLILLDVVLPGMDGFTLLKILQEDNNKITSPHNVSRSILIFIISPPSKFIFCAFI